MTATSQNVDDLYNVACAVALSSQALSAKAPAQSARFTGLTVELLERMVSQGYRSVELLKSDPDFASLHGDPRFIALLSELEGPTTSAAFGERT